MWSINKLAANVAGSLGFLDLYSQMHARLSPPQVTIIMYHGVGPASAPWGCNPLNPAVFEKEIEYLCGSGQIVPLGWLVARLWQGQPIPGRSSCITFDDGYRDNYEFAYPVLKKHGVPATVFLASGWVGGEPIPCPSKAKYAIWNTSVTEFEIPHLGRFYLRSQRDRMAAIARLTNYLVRLPRAEREAMVANLLDSLGVQVSNDSADRMMLSWEEIREMDANGITFGAHTVGHYMLTKLSTDEARRELIDSKRQIEDRLEKECKLFAYPNGDFNATAVELVKECGYRGAVTTVPRFIAAKADPFTLGRVSAGPDYNTFKGCYSGLYPDLMRLLRLMKNA